MKYKYNGQWYDVSIKALDSMPVGTIVEYDGQASDIPTGWEQVTGQNKIKKTSETTPTMASIVDGYSTSTQGAYSCNYVNSLVTPINTKLNACKVVTYDNEWIYGVNPTGLGGMVVDIPIYNPDLKTVTASFTSAQVFDGTSWLNLGTVSVIATYTTHVLIAFGTSGLALDLGKSWLLKILGSVTVSNS